MLNTDRSIKTASDTREGGAVLLRRVHSPKNYRAEQITLSSVIEPSAAVFKSTYRHCLIRFSQIVYRTLFDYIMMSFKAVCHYLRAFTRRHFPLPTNRVTIH